MRTRIAFCVAASAALVAGGCTAPLRDVPASTARRAGPAQLATATPILAAAEGHARDLGPVPPSTTLWVTLVLRDRNQTALERLLASGRTVTPEQWKTSFGPDPGSVAALEASLRVAGMTSAWSPGDSLLNAIGPASSVERLFHTPIHNFLKPPGTHFYGPVGQMSVPAGLSQVDAVTGASDYRGESTSVMSASYGLTPSEASSFYDLNPLRQSGLDGTGVTVMFPEWAMPSQGVLNAFANQYGLPPFSVTVHQMFGTPDSPTSDSATEAALDLEIVHGLAPGAKEVVYELGNANQLPQLIQTMVADNPMAVMSSSIGTGGCEAEDGSSVLARAMNAAMTRAAAQGTSVFWASGDNGAYDCLTDGVNATALDVSIGSDADSPNLTSVGGTTVFQDPNGGYGREAAWGEPLEQVGGGGGISTFFPQPSYQVAPALTAGSLSGRGEPDVSCDADPVVGGWDVILPSSSGPQEAEDGGTSAAAPCWAAITAIIDEDLSKNGLNPVGFANPALYDMSRQPAGLPATPFHQITEGTNLHYQATTGWNAATGLGTPDAAHLAADFEWYERNQS